MQTFSFSYVQAQSDELSDIRQQLLQAAQAAAEQAYAPYSNFKVGAAVLQADGKVTTGANHENAAYPAGICAERAALAAIPADKSNLVTAIAVAYIPGNEKDNGPISPCGICRQTIVETEQFQGAPIEVLMSSPGGVVVIVREAGHLLPFQFGKDFL